MLMQSESLAIARVHTRRFWIHFPYGPLDAGGKPLPVTETQFSIKPQYILVIRCIAELGIIENAWHI